MPGIIEDIITSAPLSARVVVVGVFMGADRFRPSMAIAKEIDLRFALGYTPLEFRDTLYMLADGKVDVTPLMTGTVGPNGVENAFDALGDPEAHAKILIDPKSDATSPGAGFLDRYPGPAGVADSPAGGGGFDCGGLGVRAHNANRRDQETELARPVIIGSSPRTWEWGDRATRLGL